MIRFFTPLIVKGSLFSVWFVFRPKTLFAKIKGFTPLPLNHGFEKNYTFSWFVSKDHLESEKLDYEITKHNFGIGLIVPIESVWVKDPWMKIESRFLIVTKSSIFSLQRKNWIKIAIKWWLWFTRGIDPFF